MLIRKDDQLFCETKKRTLQTLHIVVQFLLKKNCFCFSTCGTDVEACGLDGGLGHCFSVIYRPCVCVLQPAAWSGLPWRVTAPAPGEAWRRRTSAPRQVSRALRILGSGWTDTRGRCALA